MRAPPQARRKPWRCSFAVRTPAQPGTEVGRLDGGYPDAQPLGSGSAAGRTQPPDPPLKREQGAPSVGSALHGPAVAMAAVSAHLAQDDARHRFLLVVERCVERLEHLGES